MFLRASPIDVSAIVRELLLDRMRTTVLTSATLTVDGTFDYIRKRLGITGAEEICLPSEFDFRAAGDPVPAAAHARSAVGRISRWRRDGEVIEILKRTRGRAFVLFTSYATLRAVQAIAEMALDYPILVAGHGAALAAAASSSARRRTRCCSPPRASGRASTSSAKR